MTGEGLPQAPVIRPPLIYGVGLATVLVLGLNWPVMTWGLETIEPLWLTTLRLLGAGAGLAVVLALTTGLRRPPRPDYPVVASVAVIRLALVYGLVMSGLLLVPPGRSSVLTHTTALWVVPIGAWFLHERPSRMTVLGLLLGAAGIVILMEPWRLEAGGGAAVGYAMLIAAAIANAVATVHVRSHRWTATPLALMPWQLLIAGLLTLPVAVALDGPPDLAWTAKEAAVVLYQVVLASGFGVWGILTLARSLPAVSSGMLMMTVPAIGVISSGLLVGEILTAAAIGGMAMVFVGVALNVLSDRARPAQPEVAA